jgi:hypothetical protein
MPSKTKPARLADRRHEGLWRLADAAAQLRKGGALTRVGITTWLKDRIDSGTITLHDGYMDAEQVNGVLRADQRLGGSTIRLPSPIEDALDKVGWFDTTMHADQWFAMASVSPREAAALLCQCDPLDANAAPESTSNGETTPEDFWLMVRVFEDETTRNVGPHNLADWLTVARSRGCRTHSWGAAYLEAVATLGGRSQLRLGESPALANEPNPKKEPPAEAALASTRISAASWALCSPQRFPGYRKQLFDFIKAAHSAGQPEPPKARDVMDAWAKVLPRGILEVLHEGIKYEDAEGGIRTATVKSIQEAIKGLTTPYRTRPAKKKDAQTQRSTRKGSARSAS